MSSSFRGRGALVGKGGHGDRPPRAHLPPGLGLLLALVAAGCGPGRPALHGVTGEVSLDGKPVAGAGVLFCPEGGRPAAAVTDDQGRFRLRTWRDADGTLAGTHVVCVTKTVPTAAESDNPYPESKNILPSRYASPLTSPLRADVSPANNNFFHFVLEP